MTTRRGVLIGAAFAAFASFAPAFGAINTRRNITDVEKDPGALQALRDAIDVLRKKDDYGQRPAIDGWFALATTHSHFCFNNSGDHEIHYGWWFLPWHRAYLIHVERVLQKAINEPTLTLPYWDWVATPTLPKSVSEPRYQKGNATLVNPLYDDQRYGPVGQGGAVDLSDLGAPEKTEQELLGIDTFENFAGGQPDSRHTRRPGFLEATPHTYIHRSVAFDQINKRVGLMTVGMAPLDPLFFLHHANVDRLWAAWSNAGGRRANSTEPAWREHSFAFPDNKTFKLVDYRIADLIDTERSAGEYRYDRQSQSQIARAGTLVLHGIPISAQPTTIRVHADNANAAPLLIGAISTIPSQAAGTMDAVLPINDAARQFLAANQSASIRASFADNGSPVTFDGFTIDVPR